MEKLTLDLLEYPSGTRLGVWPEVKVKTDVMVKGAQKSFDYTFDYVLMPLEDRPVTDFRDCDVTPADLQAAGWKVEGRGHNQAVADAPDGKPTVIEIMTSSTSGGNKAKGTTIPMAFRRSLLEGKAAEGPGINYRQVWARMVSQLIVKSEVALGWGGQAIWVVQDVLARYISQTTALDLEDYVSDRLDEVNMLSFSYGDAYKSPAGVIELPDRRLFAGPIAGGQSPEGGGFQDIVRVAAVPPREALIRALLKRPPTNEVTAP